MKTGGFLCGVSVHDPAVFEDKNGEYYIFGTHMAAASSTDLRHWKMFAEGVGPKNPLFSNLFGGEEKAFKYCGKFNGRDYAVWAPDVSYNPYLKKYVMYFCTSGSYVKSSINMATADSVEGPYTYERTILSSGFDAKTASECNIYDVLGKKADLSRYLKKNGNYNNLAWPNCIDPNTFHDKSGKFYMVYGSWSGGIFLLEIDEKTGLPIHPKTEDSKQIDCYFGKNLLGGGHKSIEGPFIFYDEVSDYYFLFVSFGALTREGGYQIRMFRSKRPDGPYVDMYGKTFRRVSHHDPYGLKLIGNYTFPSLERAYMAPGHNSCFKDSDGRVYMVYHQRFQGDNEYHEPRVHQLFRTKSGWLTACPFATDGEMLSLKDYLPVEVCGDYYLVEHGLDISNEIHDPVKVAFTTDGKILDNGNEIGTFEVGGRANITLNVSGVAYEGVIIQLNDEAGNPTMSITGVGENQSIWATKYL